MFGRTTRQQTVDELVRVRRWNQRRGVAKPKVTRDRSADFGPDRVEYVAPLIVGQVCCIVPGLDMSISRHVGPEVMTVGSKMQSLRIGISKARKRGGKIEWKRTGRRSHRIIHRVTFRAYSWTNVSVTAIDLIQGATRGGGRMDTDKTTKSRVEAGMHIDLAGRRTYSDFGSGSSRTRSRRL
jgi:hypothetical protein